MTASVGVTEIETRVAGVTVRVAVPLAPPCGSFALIVATPSERDVARPFEPLILLIEATPVSDELQVTEFVMSTVELSVNVAVALNCRVNPLKMLAVAGVTAIEVMYGAVIVTVVNLDTPVAGSVTVTIIWPVTPGRVVACPFVPAVLLIVMAVG
jgi:hypothetical protein